MFGDSSKDVSPASSPAPAVGTTTIAMKPEAEPSQLTIKPITSPTLVEQKLQQAPPLAHIPPLTQPVTRTASMSALPSKTHNRTASASATPNQDTRKKV